ncbi:MAG: hypothetical protein MUF38_07380 [Anaerolineae bacterium]|jgi:hypothetical protein|nr:hypothetical protein [Anaerolineae bacterium]
MACTIERYPDRPIVIATFSPPFDAVKDASTTAGYLNRLLAETNGDIHYIADLSALEIDLSDLVLGMTTAYASLQSPFYSPRLKTYTVGNTELVKVGAEAAAADARYGANVRFYPHVAEALAEVERLVSLP